MPFCLEIFTWCEGKGDGPLLLLLLRMVDELLGRDLLLVTVSCQQKDLNMHSSRLMALKINSL
ncbi:hypothetical protein BDL97_06G090100 [Sphagnum fallax]|nr:hypothetical protein BDL97_06G090100 [Sphagnum fallax]